MFNQAFVQLALKSLSCSQKELSVHLNVSPTQISKWKKGEHMSFEMQEKFREITNIGDKDPQFVLLSGSIEDAEKWERLIHFLAKTAHEDDETGYIVYPLKDELEILSEYTFEVLGAMGITIPKTFPKELDFDYEDSSNEEENDFDTSFGVIEANAYAALIYKIYKSLTDVYGFYAAYISELMNNEDLNLYATPAENIEPYLLSLAAGKVEVNEEFATNIRQFRYQTYEDYKNWLMLVKNKAFGAGIPLRAELLNLIYDSNDSLGHDAETENLGFNSSRLHPDIYMNELLVGMRTIHQVLPLIMKKLEISDEFELNRRELRIG